MMLMEMGMMASLCILNAIRFDFLLVVNQLVIFKSNERSEDSYIGLADFFFVFFSGKVLKV